ncbi:MAG TPA: hypothetical protein VM580_00185 [Labilithrix sp.]|nr:hypothetical protein [Labilithrix sp.]
MSERYVRPTVAGWLTPTLIAPWLSVYGAVTAFAALGVDWGLFGKIAGWAVGMLIGSVWAFVFCLTLILVDVALLAVRVRTLPAGKRGWWTTFVSPLLVFGVYGMAPPHTFWRHGAWGVTAAIVVPMLLVALFVRLFGGQKPLR